MCLVLPPCIYKLVLSICYFIFSCDPHFLQVSTHQSWYSCLFFSVSGLMLIMLQDADLYTRYELALSSMYDTKYHCITLYIKPHLFIFLLVLLSSYNKHILNSSNDSLMKISIAIRSHPLTAITLNSIYLTVFILVTVIFADNVFFFVYNSSL